MRDLAKVIQFQLYLNNYLACYAASNLYIVTDNSKLFHNKKLDKVDNPIVFCNF